MLKYIILLVLLISANAFAGGKACNEFFSLKRGDHMIFDKNLNARLSKLPEKADQFIIGIPGGPGISGKYMDQFIFDLGKSLGRPQGVLNLPAHNESSTLGFNVKSYRDGVEQINAQIEGLIEKTGEKPILVAHSFGGVIALDLMFNGFSKFEKVILLNTPAKFELDEMYMEVAKQKGISEDVELKSESDFLTFWNNILPLYFNREITPEERQLLTHETYYFKSEKFTEGQPHSLKDMVRSRYFPMSKSSKLFIVESERDLITPSNNLTLLNYVLGDTKSTTLLGVGHFPMLESKEELENIVKTFIEGD